MLRRGWTVLVGAVVLLVLSTALSYLPVPYVALGPGPTVNTLGTYEGHQVITIAGHDSKKSDGNLNLTTVSVRDQLNLSDAIRYWIDGAVAVVPREVVYPPDQTTEQVDQQNQEAFTESQSSAETAALRVLGHPVTVSVTNIPDGSPSTGKLAKGDIITKVDGTEVTSRSHLVELVTQHKPGETLTIEYTRNGTPATIEIVTGKSQQNGQQAVLGIEIDQKQENPYDIQFDLDRIGGPSAGLMFALAIVDKIGTDDLTGGEFIAGTGEIDDDGDVGPIGGIPQKMVAAKDAGASVFLAPAGNCEEARRTVPDGLTLVKVNNLSDAIDSLKKVRDKSGSLPSC